MLAAANHDVNVALTWRIVDLEFSIAERIDSRISYRVIVHLHLARCALIRALDLIKCLLIVFRHLVQHTLEAGALLWLGLGHATATKELNLVVLDFSRLGRDWRQIPELHTDWVDHGSDGKVPNKFGLLVFHSFIFFFKLLKIIKV